MASSVSTSSDNGIADSRSNTAPSSDTLPEGDKQFTPPKSVGVSSDNGPANERIQGTSARGRIVKDGEPVSGKVRLVINGLVMGEVEPGGAEYKVAAIPVGVVNGGSSPDGSDIVQFEAEDGSVASTSLDGEHTYWSVIFGALNIEVLDAYGNPVPNHKVNIASKEFSTDSRGMVETGSSGNVTVSTLFGTASRDFSIPEGGEVNTSFSFSGVEGSVRTPTGEKISNARVSLKAANGDLLDETVTDDNGSFQFPKAPIDSTVVMESSPFSRSFTTASQDSVTLKNLPFETDDVGAAKVSVEDSKTGDRVARLPATIEGGEFASLTTQGGEASVMALIGENQTVEAELILGEGDSRYRTERIPIILTSGDTVEVDSLVEQEITPPTY